MKKVKYDGEKITIDGLKCVCPHRLLYCSNICPHFSYIKKDKEDLEYVDVSIENGIKGDAIKLTCSGMEVILEVTNEAS